MSKRQKMSKDTSKKIFSKAGAKTNSLNLPSSTIHMRGGIRL